MDDVAKQRKPSRKRIGRLINSHGRSCFAATRDRHRGDRTAGRERGSAGWEVEALRKAKDSVKSKALRLFEGILCLGCVLKEGREHTRIRRTLFDNEKAIRGGRTGGSTAATHGVARTVTP